MPPVNRQPWLPWSQKNRSAERGCKEKIQSAGRLVNTTSGPGVTGVDNPRGRATLPPTHPPVTTLPAIRHPMSTAELPIHAVAADLRQRLGPGRERPPAVVLTAPTGSGKSTQVPQLLADCLPPESGRIVVLQPRRLAARMLARRVAQERRTPLGGEVGFQVRFEDQVGRDTRIVFVTEGILLRQLLDRPQLDGVAAVVLDEFHERSLQSDLALALLHRLRRTRRPDLRLVVMSATLAPAPLLDYLQPAESLACEARTFPVEISYQPPRQQRGQRQPPWESVATACAGLWTNDPDAEALVFMPGRYEIQKTIAALRALPQARGRRLLPLYSDLPPAQQDEALEPGNQPRVIVATNVAETSLTIDGITAVIDSGLARCARYDARRGMDTLTIEPVSRASTDQRAGRAGRTRPGLCVRLWREDEQAARPERETPAIQRLDPVEAFLQVLAMGADPRSFPWFEAPLPESAERAWSLLQRLGALELAPNDDDPGADDRRGDHQTPWTTTAGADLPPVRLTGLGRRMARLPLHPRFSRMLLAADEADDPLAGAFCAALCQGRSLWIGPSDERFQQRDDRSDVQPAWRAWQAAHGAGYQLDFCKRHGIHAQAAREIGDSMRQLLRLTGNQTRLDEAARLGLSATVLQAAMLTGFPDRVAAEVSAGERLYQLPDGRRARLSPRHHIRPPSLLVAAELTEVEGRDLRVLLGTVTAIEREQLEAAFPGRLRELNEDRFDEQARRVVRRRRLCLDAMVLEDRESGTPDPDTAAELLAQRVLAGDLVLKQWDQKVEAWIARLNQLAQWMPELELPALVDEDRAWLVARICHGAISYRQVKDRPVWPALREWLSPPQHAALEAFAPESLQLPNGRKARILYEAGREPRIRLTVQQLYGVEKTPTLADGRVAVLVEILAPNQRPIQWTSDLESFWANGYPQVKKQLQGRYPKHEWR